QRLPVFAAPRAIGREIGSSEDGAEMAAGRIEDPYPARRRAVEVPFDVELDAVDDSGAIETLLELEEHAIGAERRRSLRMHQPTVGTHVECPNMHPSRIRDVEHALVGRERQAVWEDEIADYERHLSALRWDSIDACEVKVEDGIRRARIAEIGGAVRL